MITIAVCDANGENCYDQPVEEDHPNAGRVSGLPIFIDNDCPTPVTYGHGYGTSYGTSLGCHATYGCNCHEKLYVIPNGDKWLISHENACATKCK